MTTLLEEQDQLMIAVIMGCGVRAPRSVRCETFPATRDQVAHARRITAETLADHQLCDLVVLLVSELATNVVRHSSTARSFTLVIAVFGNGDLRVAVSNDGDGDGFPHLRAGGPDDTCGRGLRIVDRYATRWGVTRAGGWLTVWLDITDRLGDQAIGTTPTMAPDMAAS